MANSRPAPTRRRSRRACRAARPPAAAEAALDPLPFDGEAAREYGGVFASVMAAGRKAHERSTCSSSQRRSRPGCRCTPGTATTSGHSTASGGRRRADGWHRGASQPAPHRQDPGRRSVCSLCACQLHAGRTCRSAASPLKSTSAFTPAPSTLVTAAGHSLGCLGVARRRLHQPHRALGVVDAIPEPTAAGDLVLPLLHLLPVDRAAAEAAPQRMLSIGALARVGGELLPRRARVARSSGADLLPSLDGVACSVAKVPAAPLRAAERPAPDASTRVRP